MIGRGTDGVYQQTTFANTLPDTATYLPDGYGPVAGEGVCPDCGRCRTCGHKDTPVPVIPCHPPHPVCTDWPPYYGVHAMC